MTVEALLRKPLDALENLLEQRRRQLNEEATGRWGSYPTKFPEWEQAWKLTRETVWGIEAHLEGEE